MVQQSTLLQIIQFVGLITPALAVLIELLIRFHGGLEQLQDEKELPIEIQILFLGFSAILLGGMGVGVQMVLTLDNSITQFAALLIFGGLPLLAASVLAMNIRISPISDPSANLVQGFSAALQYTSSVGLPLLLSTLLYFGLTDWLRQWINTNLNWWIFVGNLEPVWYFYIVAAILVYKIMYSLFTHNTIPSDTLSNVMNDWFITSFTAGAFFLIVAGLVFVLYRILISLSLPFVTATSYLSAIPYIWSGFVVFALLYNELNPNQD
ncbi:hypothetical protein [Haloarcula argentinensis]|uniref:Uncharacterized protein n=1 Tax=Haloarcula argentinensis TaxID=43776 RepID=A0A847UJP1_HALAR|nr:hypothetical protein [Haloarcula argentinensis]NLV14075.1 hypothetical protein [Haloarcula argentinensis]